MKETIKDRSFVPVIVKGFKRVFNLDEGKGGDVLNLTKSKSGFFNGVMFSINDQELKKLKEREDDYNLEMTTAYDFITRKKRGRGFVDIDYIVGIDRKKKRPNLSYLMLCREAAYHISNEFGEMWDETTYTADGKKISAWIKNSKERISKT